MEDQQFRGTGPEGSPRHGSSRSSRRRRTARGRQNSPLCPVCQKPVRDLYSAITHRDSGSPAHFDCILQNLRVANDLSPSEKLCYLGGGTFGIIQYRNPQSPIRFLIRKRIQYEPTEPVPEWRRSLPRKTKG